MYAGDYGNTSFAGIGGVFILGIGSLVLGVLVMALCELRMPDFFRGRTGLSGGRADSPEATVSGEGDRFDDQNRVTPAS